MSSMIKITNAKVVIDPSAVVSCDSAGSIPVPTRYKLWSGPMNNDYTLVGNSYNFTNNISTLKDILGHFMPFDQDVVMTENVQNGIGTIYSSADVLDAVGYDTFDFNLNYGGNLFFENLPLLQTIYIGNHSVESCTVDNCSSLASFSSMNSNDYAVFAFTDCSSLVSIYLDNCGGLELGGYFALLQNITIDNSSLPQSNVDSILQFMDEINTTNGTINIRGSAAAPSAQGLVYKNNLVAKGFTVLHN